MPDNDIYSILHPEFLDRMKSMLEDEYDAFIDSYNTPRTYGLRVNTSKISCEDFEKMVPFPVTKIPWISNGYFYPEDVRPSFCPMYQAGLYYLQEPSAMTPASVLSVTPGENVLDLCAAPGGKATALGDKLKGQGLLVANDISASRAKALLRNIEMFGITNAFVSNETPERLSSRFPEFFHKILLDAPCSGEGMFRKEEALARDWTPSKSHELSLIQRDLIIKAADMLRPGGQLLYSTCTFAPEEDEDVVSFLLDNRSDMELISIPEYEGFTPGQPDWGDGNPSLNRCVHLFPHKMQGEGHFMALFQKEGKTDLICQAPRAKQNADTRKWLELFFNEIGLHSIGGRTVDWNRIETHGDKVYYLPPVSGDLKGLTFLRNGLYIGDLKKNRFEPSQQLALALHKDDVDAIVSLPVSDQRLTRYLKGETLLLEPDEATHPKGWHLLCVDKYPLGFGKLVNQTLKNKYPAGWRV